MASLDSAAPAADRSPLLVHAAGALALAALAAAALVEGGARLAAAAVGASPQAFLASLPVAAALVALPLGARGPLAAARAEAWRTAGRAGFYAGALALSFGEVARALRWQGPPGPLFLAVAVPAGLAAAALLAAGLRRPDVEPLARGEAMLAGATVIALFLGLGLESGGAAALVANLALAFLAAGRIVRGASAGRPASLAEGLAVAAALGLARVAG
jgi:hypothetical protein